MQTISLSSPYNVVQYLESSSILKPKSNIDFVMFKYSINLKHVLTIKIFNQNFSYLIWKKISKLQ